MVDYPSKSVAGEIALRAIVHSDDCKSKGLPVIEIDDCDRCDELVCVTCRWSLCLEEDSGGVEGKADTVVRVYRGMHMWFCDCDRGRGLVELEDCRACDAELVCAGCQFSACLLGRAFPVGVVKEVS